MKLFSCLMLAGLMLASTMPFYGSPTIRTSVGLAQTLSPALLLPPPQEEEPEPPKARKFSEYQGQNNGSELAQLDGLASELQQDPTATAYILIYPGRRDYPDMAEKQANSIRKYFENSRGIDPARLVAVIKCKVRVLTVELWIVPPGANPPQ